MTQYGGSREQRGRELGVEGAGAGSKGGGGAGGAGRQYPLLTESLNFPAIITSQKCY